MHSVMKVGKIRLIGFQKYTEVKYSQFYSLTYNKILDNKM